MECWLFLPQMRMSMDDLVARAVAAEAAGFAGIALMDHLLPPLAEATPMWEAMTAATWLAARTTTLRVGHLVLCDAMRHPAVLAKQAVTLDHASGGRFELGLGWGSVPGELTQFGITGDGGAARVARLAESLEIIERLWSGEVVDHDGRWFALAGARQAPMPLDRIPLVVGGTGPATMELVRRHADWWNVPVHQLDRLDALRSSAGSARVSTQQMVGFVADPSERAAVTEAAARRFGTMAGGLMVGHAAEVQAMLAGLAARGVERTYLWFTDFAAPATLAAFGEQVIGRW